jgi:hypothetical protein
MPRFLLRLIGKVNRKGSCKFNLVAPDGYHWAYQR